MRHCISFSDKVIFRYLSEMFWKKFSSHRIRNICIDAMPFTISQCPTWVLLKLCPYCGKCDVWHLIDTQQVLANSSMVITRICTIIPLHLKILPWDEFLSPGEYLGPWFIVGSWKNVPLTVQDALECTVVSLKMCSNLQSGLEKRIALAGHWA